MESTKQKYIVFSDINNDYDHKNLYFASSVGNNINIVYDKIKYLGLIIDSRLNWNYHVNFVENNMKRVYFLIYDKFKYADLRVGFGSKIISIVGYSGCYIY